MFEPQNSQKKSLMTTTNVVRKNSANLLLPKNMTWVETIDGKDISSRYNNLEVNVKVTGQRLGPHGFLTLTNFFIFIEFSYMTSKQITIITCHVSQSKNF